MSETLKYVSEGYQTQLEELAASLVTPERFGGKVALAEVIQFPVREATPDDAA